MGDAVPYLGESNTSEGGCVRRASEGAWDPGQFGEEEFEDLHLFPCEEEEEAAAWMYSVSASDVGSGSA